MLQMLYCYNNDNFHQKRNVQMHYIARRWYVLKMYSVFYIAIVKPYVVPCNNSNTIYKQNLYECSTALLYLLYI